MMKTHSFEHIHRTLPFCKQMIFMINENFFVFDLVVMKPYTIINQTLHSYCKEQTHFNTEPMFLNLTQ